MTKSNTLKAQLQISRLELQQRLLKAKKRYQNWQVNKKFTDRVIQRWKKELIEKSSQVFATIVE